MPIPQLPGGGLNTLQDVISYVIRLERELRFLMEGGLDSSNMFEVGGWRVKPYQFSYKDNMVGMSSAGTSGTSIRFWAGSSDPTTAPFRVQHDGTIYSTKGYIGGWTIGTDKLSGTGILEGGIVRTAATGRRIELSGSKLKSMSDATLDGFTLDAADGYLKWYTNNSLTGYIGKDTSQSYEQMLISHDYLDLHGITSISLTTPNVYIGDTTAKIYIKGLATSLGVPQADSTATDVAGLKTDFNTLLANLRSMGILS